MWAFVSSFHALIRFIADFKLLQTLIYVSVVEWLCHTLMTFKHAASNTTRSSFSYNLCFLHNMLGYILIRSKKVVECAWYSCEASFTSVNKVDSTINTHYEKVFMSKCILELSSSQVDQIICVIHH